jgi:ribosomal protein S27AE
MYIKAQIVVESYMPHTLEKGMWFVRKHYEGTVREYSEIFELFKVPQDKDEFLTRNGYPVSLMVVQEYLDGSPPSILARSEEIGWWDEPEIDEYHTVDIDLVNLLINDFNGFVSIDVDPDGIPVLLSDQVILSYPEDDDEEEEFDETLCYNCGSNDIDFNSSGEYTCNNCGYEENEKTI